MEPQARAKALRGFLGAFGIIAAVGSSGCATITRGTSEQLLVQSEPSGAMVRLSNGFTGVTPASFTIPRKGDMVVTIAKDGYEPAEIMVKAKVSSAGATGFAGNILIGGIIGGGVDAATGAALSHVPNPVKVTLIPKKAPDDKVAGQASLEKSLQSEARESETREKKI